MKAVVVYKLGTGFTKKYAEWIAEELGCECVDYGKRSSVNVEDYDAVIYGGSFKAGMIGGVKWLKEKLPELKGKKVVAFVVGMMPANSSDVEKNIAENFKDVAFENLKTFYCPGGMDPKKLGFFSRQLLKMLSSSLSKKADATPEMKEMAAKMVTAYDETDRKYLKPLLEYVRE